MALEEMNDVEYQIRDGQEIVGYYLSEYTIEFLMFKYDDGEIFIPPYQRLYVWDEVTASRFIESMLLGLPVPYIFAAESGDDEWEIIDGSQRIRAISAFVKNELCLEKLKILDKLNGLYFKDLLPSRQRKFKNASLKIVSLSDKTSDEVKYMVFQRINTGGITLNAMEQRKGLYYPFVMFLEHCTKHPLFEKLIHFSEAQRNRAEAEDWVLRFFAYSERLETYHGNLREFLDQYTQDQANEFKYEKYAAEKKEQLYRSFDNMLKFVDSYLDDAFVNDKKIASVFRFEAVSVGVQLALQENPNFVTKNRAWVHEADFEEAIKGPWMNSAEKVKKRIEFVKKQLLGKQ